MVRALALRIAMTGAVFGWSAAAAAESSEANTVFLRPVANLQSSDMQPQIIGGVRASPRIWPATLIFRSVSGSGCTATTIGSRVVLSAAHCLDGFASAAIPTEGRNIQLRCNAHPDYIKQNQNAPEVADFALCTTNNEDLPVPSDGYERLSTDKDHPAASGAVTLLGYGCTQVSGKPDFGALFQGDATVSQVRDSEGFVHTSGGPAVCSGDSGGGSYFNVDAVGQIRRLFAISTFGDRTGTTGISKLTPTAAPTFVMWATSWAGQNHVAICGLTPDAQHCRQ